MQGINGTNLMKRDGNANTVETLNQVKEGYDIIIIIIIILILHLMIYPVYESC